MVGKINKFYCTKEKFSNRQFLKKTSINYSGSHFFGKIKENLNIRIKVELIRKDDCDKIIKEQSKLTFIGIHKCYTKYERYTFKQNEVLKDRPIYLEFSVLDMSKLLMFETYNDKLQNYSGQENLHLHYMDTDNFVSSMNTKDIIKDLKNLEDIFDFSNLSQNLDLFSNKNKTVIGKIHIETPKNLHIDEFTCLRSKMCAFKCGDNS